MITVCDFQGQSTFSGSLSTSCFWCLLLLLSLHCEFPRRICVLGDRILSGGDYVCSKERNVSKSLWHEYCKVHPNATSEDDYSCYPYFENHDAELRQALPGLESGVFFSELPSSFSVTLYLLLSMVLCSGAMLHVILI